MIKLSCQTTITYVTEEHIPRGSYTLLCLYPEYDKNANSIGMNTYVLRIDMVWRQLELAFFGALTSVGALFIFVKKTKNFTTIIVET